MEEDNIKKKKYFKEDSQKAFQNREYLEVVFGKIFKDLKQIILQKDGAIPNVADGNKKKIQTY